jgi:hypothetical protein
MTEYSLHSLLKIRERKKETAELYLQTAITTHKAEQKKLSQIEIRLRDTIVARTERQNNFFHKALINPSSKTEVTCHVLSHQKTMIDEIDLRKMLAQQQEQVRSAERNVEVAKHAAIDAERNLKVIEKHYSSWKRMLLRAEEIREEYATDDQNGVRYLLKKA